MKINKILVILLFALISEVIVSCCDCVDPLIGYYTNQTIVVKNIDNSGSEPITTAASSVPKEAFGIRTELRRERTACLSPSKSFFIQSAYASNCDCPPTNQLLPRDSLIKFQIFTINDFDINHPANSDVSEYFKGFKNSSFVTTAEYFAPYNSVLVSDSELELTFDMLLMTPPDLNTNHSFRVKITLSDGRILESITSNIELE